MQEARSSITFKMLDPDGIEFLITVRESENNEDPDTGCLKRAHSLALRAKEKGWTATTHRAPAVHATPSTTSAPSSPRQEPQQGGGLSFTADTLTVEFNAKGEKTAKLKGGAFAKFGVRLWPEVAAQLGFDLNQYQAGDYRIDSMAVRYVNNDEGKPSKIVGRV